MSRIHGDKKIIRRINIKKKTKYRDYLNELKADFQDICGYCGKPTSVTKNTFEIDHFVPQKIDKDRVNDYTNLVYSCFQCNRKKSRKWPTGDANIPNDGKVGFVDPASQEFDKHLERLPNGKIIGKTEVGNYMIKAFAFDKRPMCELWKLTLLLNKRDKLLNTELVDSDTMQCLKNVVDKIDNLFDYMFDCKE